MYDHGMTGWGYALMALGTVGFWALVALAAMALLRRPAAGPHVPGPTPQQLLAERFARGEIDDDEYYQRLATLEYGGPPQKKR